MNPRLRELRERIGGRYALSLPIFLIGSPFWIVGLVANEPAGADSLGNSLALLGIATLGQAVMGLTLWLGHLTVGRHRSERPMSLTVLVFVWSASALTRLAVIVTGLEFFDLPNGVPLPTRAVVSVLLAVVAFGLASYVVDGLARFRDERAALLQQLLESESQLEAHRSAVSSMKAALVSRVDKKLGESRQSSEQALDQLESALLTQSDPSVVLEGLRELSDTTWQKVSSELWRQGPATAPRIRVREFLPLFAASGPFRPHLLAMVAPFLYLLIYSRVFDPALGAILTLAWLGSAVAFGLAANWLLGKMKRMVVPSLFLLIGAMVLSSVPVLAFAETMGAQALFPARVITIHAVCLMVVTMAASPPTVTLARQTVLDNLQQHMDRATLEKLHVESQLAIVSQKLANQLHGDVRGNFLAAVLNLQRNIDNGQVDEARVAIANLRRALAEPLGVGLEGTDDREELATFISNWSAILDVSFDTPLENVPDEFMPAVHTVVVDAINNAVRHGDADWVRIGFTIEPDALVLNIRNNGTERASSRVGLGTLHLNQLAPDKWSRFSTEQGIVQLVVRLERDHLSAFSGRV